MNNLVVSNENRMLVVEPGHNLAKTTSPRTGLWPYVLFGLFVLSFFVGGALYWGLTAKLDGAVIAPASFVVEGNRKTVQHLEGGYVRDLLVKDGDFVQANQVLVRLDSTENEVELDVLGGQFIDLTVRRARLLAELQEKERFEFSELISTIDRSVEPRKLEAVFLTQKKIFDAQLNVRRSSEEVLNQRITSLEQEIDGLQEQRAANDRQVAIALEELVVFEDLFKRGYTAKSRVNNVKRELERLKGQIASFKSSQARARNQIGELRLTSIGQNRERREAAIAELASVEAQISSVEPRYLGAVQKQQRIEVKAPVSGRVVNMNIYTKGGVIRPSEPILDIVPADEELIVQARVNTTDIEKLHIGQTTRIRITAFDLTDIPEAHGQIVDLSADSVKDEATGVEFFVAKVRLDKVQSEHVRDLEFIPGMPADVFVNTGQRTAINYLTQPLRERIARTFIE